MIKGINAPGRPRYVGEYRVFQSPESRDVLLVDRAELRPGYSFLQWAAVEDDFVCKAVLAAYSAEGLSGIAHPDIRTSTLRQYATSLTGLTIERGAYPDHLCAQEIGRNIVTFVLNQTAATPPIPWAIGQGLERDTPYLAEIEKMLALIARLPPSHLARKTLREKLTALRHGSENLGMPDSQCPNTLIFHRLKELQLAYPIISDIPVPEPELERENIESWLSMGP